ncbi:MAG: PqqD family protein [Acidobacteria bacterium]|nr:MAG: PqqD family protein [Acidobacteriota bacterium]REK01479.1 MAG: PqqD family protein [Acidobacteriota bacterium]REK14435.1 MAG: PqqD family protein [Acidobacteriota bacterium]REK45150.1 MAG: PqqD family protein [Acidobacteriota bacterium]
MTSKAGFNAEDIIVISSSQNPSDLPRFRAIKEHLYSDLNGEAVILSLKNGKYYGLNEVGMTIWGVVREGGTLEEIARVVISEYDVDPETCRREVNGFVGNLVEEGLVEKA